MKSTKIFFDTEFTGLHQDTTLVSIALVSECGKTFYAELTDYNKSQFDRCYPAGTLNNLILRKPTGTEIYSVSYQYGEDNPRFCGSLHNLKYELSIWLKQFKKVEMWSDCISYDWILFSKIWSNIFKLPKKIHPIPFDICVLFKVKGMDTNIDREEYSEIFVDYSKPNTLLKAMTIRECYLKINKLVAD
jgi:hypothetical protein